MLSVASSGVAALLLHGGRTAHSVFKIPLDIDETSQCAVSSNSILAAQLRNVDIIIWDEAPMTHKHSIEAVDRLLRDLMEVNLPRLLSLAGILVRPYLLSHGIYTLRLLQLLFAIHTSGNT